MAVMVILFQVACTSVVEKDKGVSEQLVEGSSADDVAVEQAKEEQVTEISPEVLYLLMTAEIAGQRNLYGVALDGYLQAAKRVDDVRIAERAAKIGLFLKDSSKTGEAVSLWLKQDGKNLSARRIAVLSAIRNRDKSQAVEHLNIILENDPAGFGPALMELMKVLGKDVDAEFILDVVGDLADKHPDSATVNFVQALLAADLRKESEAKEKIAKALELQPDWNKALILQAQIAVQTKDLDLARDNLTRVLEKEPENNRVRKMLGQVLIKAGAFDDAIQLYQEFLDDNPDDGESRFAIALIYLQENNDEQALTYLKALVNKPKWDAQASFYIGRIMFKQEAYEDALTWFEKVTQGPYVYDASMATVSVLLNQKNFAEAEKRLQDFSIQFPKQKVNIVLLTAELYSEQQKHQQAYDVLTDALLEFGDDRDLLYTRALVAEKVDKLSALEADLKKILEKHPDDAAALNALGYTLVDRTERYTEAEQYLNQAIKLKPNEAVIIDSMGWLQFKQGKKEEALQTLRKAYEIQDESEIAAHLAEVLWVLGDKAEARNVFDKAIKKSPEDEYLLKFQQNFLQ